MSVQEIEQAIAKLQGDEVEELAKWWEQFRNNPPSTHGQPSGSEASKDTLADALGDLIGIVGSDRPAISSSRNSGEQFTDYLVDKKRARRL